MVSTGCVSTSRVFWADEYIPEGVGIGRARIRVGFESACQNTGGFERWRTGIQVLVKPSLPYTDLVPQSVTFGRLPLSLGTPLFTLCVLCNDVRDTAQLLIFIRGINEKFEVTEELAALQSIKGTTTGEDIYEKVRQTVADLRLDWAKLTSVTTDGAPSMVGSARGVIVRINREMSERGHPRPIAIHCLIHQQALCCKAVKWDSVMKVVVPCVNLIKANALNHRQFQELLSELDAAYGDVLYHTEVRWLSRGRVLKF
ncbi:hypothetical protein SRHO_G00006180 [Serrasalmus rhombeus]